MARRYEDWLAQAQRDVKAAADSLEAGNHEWSAFQSQQGAEKALKALLRFHNFEMTGHTLTHLLRKVGDFVEIPQEYQVMARELDRHYIQPRYPNSFAEGYPGEFYDENIARRCVEYGQRFIQFVEKHIS